MNDQVPTVGRIVHYVSYGTPVGGEYPSVCRAAIITEAPDLASDPGIVGLCILNPTGQSFDRSVSYSVTGRPGTWHWPERA